jgi:subtilase family serine protease
LTTLFDDRETMNRPRGVIAATALSATTMAAAFAVAAAVPAGQANAVGIPAGLPSGTAVTLPDSVAPFVATGRMTGAVPTGSKLTIQFWLKPRTVAAERYATAVSTPGSPQFGHFLSPAAYASGFGATPAAASAVMSWLRAAGFTGVGDDLYRDYVQATAPVATINAALKVRLENFLAAGQAGAGRYPLRANDRPVSLPAALAGDILGVTGLDNAAPVMTYARPGGQQVTSARRADPATFPCSQWYLQHVATGLPKLYHATRFATVVCGYTPQQLRRAYGYSNASTGKGVTVALVEVGLAPDMFQTLQMYAKARGIQAPSPRRYAEMSLGKGSACGDPFDVEEQLDVESAYDMAPAANELVVGGDSCNNGFFGFQSLFDADLAILNGVGGHPLAGIASNSWESGDEAMPADMLAIQHSYLVRAAAEGVSMLFSSGDFSGVEVPSSDPYATAVGGTTLGIGHSNPRLFETGWSTGVSVATNGRWVFQGEAGGAGGGASLLWDQPAYQRGVVPRSLARTDGNRGGLVRTAPDISAVADPYTAMAVGLLSFDDSGNVNGYFEEPIGGTSLSTPLVAGLVADAEQGQRPFGFLNPVLYRMAGTSALHDVRPLSDKTASKYRGVACDEAMCGVLLLTAFDDQSRHLAGYTGQVTAPGYDTMTGVGTPNGPKFIAALRRIEK